MLRLTAHDRDDDATLIFPAQAARFLRSGLVESDDASCDAGSIDAAKQVEAAMKEVELRFENLRSLLGFPGDDWDRPRAA
jgi:hypothetical protein